MIYSPSVLNLLLAVYTIGYTPEGNIQPPPEVKTEFQKMFPNSGPINWEMEDDTYEGKTTLDDRKVNVTFSSEGQLIEIKEDIPYTEIPENLRSVFEKQLPDCRITKASKIWSNGKSKVYFTAQVNGDEPVAFLQGKDPVKKINRVKKYMENPGNDASMTSSFDNKWDLPESLTEISGIALISNHLMACIQDELGSIFIYDLRDKKIREEIRFAGPGDYEGIALISDDAYVLRSDGVLFEVTSYLNKNRSVNQYRLDLAKQEQNFEGLCYDQKSNRLLLAPRAFDSYSITQKGVYAFYPDVKKFSGSPVFHIDLKDPIFNYTSKYKNNKKEAFIPSEIAIHPINGDIYISDARNRKVLVMDSHNKIKKLHSLNAGIFPKTEGLVITNDGYIYFSNEGKKDSPNILLMHSRELK